ncbi:2OG-Fe(II) oxygenase [uncultured Altererythrobacter sp.]|uniref:2OG-Fe(II) oxygenase n=1 Tax=uncultured Altererythrobacter sp. TaxID=500840 RepID=UPI0025F273FC|nr:2OG-Fe(II) oxygenase [uncultured Altererythrobacter sp.]
MTDDYQASRAVSKLLQVGAQSLWANAEPYPFIIVDDWLDSNWADEVHNEILQAPTNLQSNDFVFAKAKFENPDFALFGPGCSALHSLLIGTAFSDALSKITGQDLIIDPTFLGGGVHRGGRGSYLDMHTDFLEHPNKPNLHRRLNILLYLNKNWEKGWGGDLRLRHIEEGETFSIPPIFNRLVIMESSEVTLHGYTKINIPEGRFRTSVAAYAYSSELSSGGRSFTTWYPEKSSIRRLIAQFLPMAISLKRRFFGSRTASRSAEEKQKIDE